MKRLHQLQIPYEEILSATNKFSEANLIGEDTFGKEYKGQLLRSGQLVDIVARRLDNTKGKVKERFWKEVSLLATLEHQNIVSIMGLCDEHGEKIVIHKHDESTRGNLDQHLTDPTLLTWVQRLQICVGVARALSYIHYDEGRDFSAIHRDITSSKILLDEQWEAKLSGFELSMTQTATERNRPCQLPDNDFFGTPEYMDQTYYDNGIVSHKSDMFSFGVVLIEVLCSKGTVAVKEDGMYLYESAISHYRDGSIHNLVHPGLGKQMVPESFNIFSETAYSCLDKQPSERPSIDQIVKQLEKALESQQIYENRERFAHLRIPLEEIVSATNNFSDANFIREDGFIKEYKGQLLQSGKWIDIVARRFDETKTQRDSEFWTEVSMLSRLEHQNIVSIVGFCEEDGQKIVIRKHESIRRRLNSYVSDPTLTWMQRLQICVGVGHALSYIYYDEGRDFTVIHRDITSSSVLVDDRWEPKLSGFELSISQPAAERGRPYQLPDDEDIWSTPGCSDPTYLETRSVSHKSDIFSLGVVLFQLLCGNRPTKKVKGDNEMHLYQLAKSHFEGETLLYDLVTPGLRNQMGPESFNIFSKIAYECLKAEPSQRPSIDQIVTQLENALKSQRIYENQFAHLQIPLKEIVSATNFSDENFIRKDGFIKEYKGQILRSRQRIDIVARRFDETKTQRDSEFWTEVSMLSRLEHQNIVSIVGFCEEDGQKIVIRKHESIRRSLNNYVSDPTLTWMQRLQICVGVGHALSYIHYDESRDFSVIHRDITSSSILLDDRWEPKLSGFELSISQPAAERGCPFQLPDDEVIWSTPGCSDPTYLETRSVSHKSDMFSLGVVLFELVCSKSTTKPLKEDEMYLYQSAISHYLEGRLYDLVHLGVRKQMGPESFKIISETAYSCLNKQPSERPSIDQIVRRLEKALESQRIYENRKQFANLRIPLEEIVSATNDFSDENLIRNDGSTKEYKGLLLWSGEWIDIVARRLDETKEQRDTEFWMEVSMLSRLKHQNIVSIVGFCEQDGQKIVIQKYECTRGKFHDYLTDPRLTWMLRLEICVGVARASSYIHYDKGRNFSVIHRDITSYNILLDGRWEPKLSGFTISISQPAAERGCPFQLPNAYNICSTRGCSDPSYIETGSVSHKSDMFSLGVVLFELLCGKSATKPVKEDEMYLYQSAISHYREGKLYDLVHPGLGEQMVQKSFKIFSEIAYSCLNEEPSERPSIDQILIQLEKALESQRKHEKYQLISNDYSMFEGTTSSSLKYFAHLQLPLNQIISRHQQLF